MKISRIKEINNLKIFYNIKLFIKYVFLYYYKKYYFKLKFESTIFFKKIQNMAVVVIVFKPTKSIAKPDNESFDLMTFFFMTEY